MSVTTSPLTLSDSASADTRTSLGSKRLRTELESAADPKRSFSLFAAALAAKQAPVVDDKPLAASAAAESSTKTATIAAGTPRAEDIKVTTAGSDTEGGFVYDNPENDLLVYIVRYKTERCSRKPCARTCQKYHSLKERRRCPLTYDYSEQPCPAVKQGSASDASGRTWGDPSKCPAGDSCPLSHTLLEQMYHPRIYKTGLCNKYHPGAADPEGSCAWGPLCTHAHGAVDRDKQSKALAKFNVLRAKLGLPPVTEGERIRTASVSSTTSSTSSLKATPTTSSSVPKAPAPISAPAALESTSVPVGTPTGPGTPTSSWPDLSYLRAFSAPVSEFSSATPPGIPSLLRPSSLTSAITRPVHIAVPPMMSPSASASAMMEKDITSWSPLQSSFDWVSSPRSSLEDEMHRLRTERDALSKLSPMLTCAGCGRDPSPRWFALAPCGRVVCGSCAHKSDKTKTCECCEMPCDRVLPLRMD